MRRGASRLPVRTPLKSPEAAPTAHLSNRDYLGRPEGYAPGLKRRGRGGGVRPRAGSEEEEGAQELLAQCARADELGPVDGRVRLAHVDAQEGDLPDLLLEALDDAAEDE